MADIASEHEGVVIEYRRSSNTWRFDLNGKEYDMQSLVEAENKIDAIRTEINKKARKKFEPIPAFSPMFKPGRITSIAVGRSWRGNDCKSVWFVSDIGDRSKIDIADLYHASEHNKQLHAKLMELNKQRNQTMEAFTKMSDTDLATVPEAE